MTSRHFRARRYERRPPASTIEKSHATRGASRSRWVSRLAGTMMLTVLGATVVYWFAALRETMTTSHASPTITPVSPQTNRTKLLFGGELNPRPERVIRLAAVLSMRKGAAAIVGGGYAPPHAVSLGAYIMPGMKLVA